MGRIPNAVQRRVRAQARNRCGYCLSQQKYVHGYKGAPYRRQETSGSKRYNDPSLASDAALLKFHNTGTLLKMSDFNAILHPLKTSLP
jgi:hypothetical protein